MAASGRSVMVHVEGAMAHSCRTPVRKLSGAFLDHGYRPGRPWFRCGSWGGLPVAPVRHEIEFPWHGPAGHPHRPPLSPDELRRSTIATAASARFDAINHLGPPNDVEEPLSPDPAFAPPTRALVESTVRPGPGRPVCILEQLRSHRPR